MPDRRAVCAAGVAVLLWALGGCLGGDPAGSADTRTATDEGDDDPGATDVPGGASSLDLREANVVGVAVSGAPGEDVRFDVTLHHDDDGEAGYADRWQVERLDGAVLGRRELLHAHATAPFTRSMTVAVPEEARCLVVRGHDQTHGYGGRAMTVDVASGASRAVDQGPERRPVARGECPRGGR